ncbi:DUF3157 family protein [Vibrio sp. HN007]|uniref:DUF3157 family protein n=1 Tax=Vibrio iocasae TaxID=3098914 RepID=UPI0035D4A88B
MKKTLTLLTLVCSFPALSGETVLLKDGREIQINDDFTWQYVVKKNETSKTSVAINSIPIVQATSNTLNKGTLIEPGSKKDILQLSDSGVDILLGKPEYQSGSLTIPTSVTNQGSQSIISVEIELSVYDVQNNLLFKEEVAVWKSIKRMADTYLRPKTAKEGKELVIALPEQKQYIVQASVTQVESR